MILPVKLAGHTMSPAGQIHPISMSQSWRTDGLSSCTITIMIDDEIQLALGDWVLVTSPHGHMSGVFYVKNVKTNYINQQVTISLEHTFGLLQEVVAFGEITPETIGGTGVTTTNINTAINYMLNFQTERLWNLHQNDYPDISQGWKFTHQDVYSALETIKDNVPDCQWEFDQSTLPWKVSLKAFPTTAIMEMRMSRNIESMTVTLDRSQMYTRVYPTGKKNLHIDSVNGGSSYLEKNTAQWGVISQVLTDSTIDSATLLKNWAQTNLDKHSVPSVSVTVGGLDLSEATGEPLDALQIGRLCRIPLPEYGMTVTERIVELSWSNCIVSEDQVQVTLADELKTIQGVLYQLTKSGHHGKKANTSKDCDLEEHEEKIEEFDNADIWVNRDSVWAVCGQYNVITDSDGNVHLQIKDGGFLEVERDGVYETVGTSQAITDLANTITGSALWTQRNNITGVVGEFDVVGSGANRRLVIKSGGGLKIERNNVEYGVYDSGNLDAGVIVEMLSNGTTTTKIKADYITLDGEAVADSLINEELYINNKLDVGGYFSYQASDVGWCSFIIDGVTYDEPMFLGTGDLSFSVADTQVCQALVSAAGQITGRWSQIHSGDTYSPVYTASTSQDSESITVGVSSNGWAGVSAGHPGSCIVYATAGGANRAHISISGDEPYQRGYIDGGGGSSSTIRGSWNGDTYTVTGGSNALSTTVAFNNGGWVAPAVGESANNYTRNISVKADGTDTVLTQTISASAVYDIGENSVGFDAFTFSGNTHIVTTRTMYANISNGKTKGLENQLLLDYNSDNGQDGWFGSAPDYQKYVFWRTAAEGTTSWSSRMRGTISGQWVYNKGYADGVEAAGVDSSAIQINVPTICMHQTKPSEYTEIFTGGRINTNNRYYAFQAKINGQSGYKGYCFYVSI